MIRRLAQLLADLGIVALIVVGLLNAVGVWIDEPDLYNPPPARSASK